jgi:hypothetical protein
VAAPRPPSPWRSLGASLVGRPEKESLVLNRANGCGGVGVAGASHGIHRCGDQVALAPEGREGQIGGTSAGEEGVQSLEGGEGSHTAAMANTVGARIGTRYVDLICCQCEAKEGRERGRNGRGEGFVSSRATQ